MSESSAQEPNAAWVHFVVKHTHPGNLAFHAVSLVLFWVAPVIALVEWSLPWLVAFLLSGLVGTAGHHLFGEGDVTYREATSTPMIPLYVAKMFWMLARGEWWPEVERMRVVEARMLAELEAQGS